MTLETKFYTWQNHKCAYEVHHPENSNSVALLTIHPIGVGLSRHFWQRFCREWYAQGNRNPIYNPDLLGCGESDMPRAAYFPEDWAKQLQFFIQTVVQKPVIVVVQGALFPVAIALAKLEANPIKALVLSGPPSWSLMTESGNLFSQKLSWNLLFDAPLGNAFYRYARREKFVRSFSIRQLFSKEQDVDSEWLEMLKDGSQNLASRYAVFSFLAGFWRQNYRDDLQALKQPIFAVFGEQASGISQTGKTDTAQKRLDDYRKNIPNCAGSIAPGRNVMPYEATAEFVKTISSFIGNY